jgi:hypothetical protein
MTQLTLSTSIAFQFIQEWLPNYQKTFIGFENGGTPLSIGWKLNLNSGQWMLQLQKCYVPCNITDTVARLKYLALL